MSDKPNNRKPPKEYQFKAGVSGNPRGRPPKPNNLEGESLSVAKIVDQALIQEVRVLEDGKTIKLPIIKVVINKALRVAAESGDVKLLDQTMKLAEKLDKAALSGRDPEPLVIRVIGGLPDDESET